jgi:choline dehydrogenase-like flavoprotein
MGLQKEHWSEINALPANKRFLRLFGIPRSLQKAHQIANYSSWPGKAKSQEGQSDVIWQLNTRLEQRPNPDSRITLDFEKRDALGQPQLRLDWRLTELDKRSIRVAEQLLASELEKTGAGRLQIPEWLMAEDNAWPSYLVGGPHHMGTTRMSTHAGAGVVDANCRVHGMDNLYIAGSSVFTTGGTANPTLTIVALAARLAGHIKENVSS